jgi:PTH1 family peptidyl-tRNA hydrolase
VSEGLFLAVGLGNPGPTYAGNRHNVGAMVIQLLADRLGARFKAHRSRAQVAETRLGPPPAHRLVLAKPLSFMNESGGPVAGLCQFYKVEPAYLVVVHDELDIPFGAVRLKLGGGDNGHNGLRSISRSIGGPDYFRVRVGIGRPPGRQDPADFVLRDFAPAQRPERDLLLERSADALEELINRGLAEAQNRYHAP